MTWTHICPLESVISRFGILLKYYTDYHSIFRFVQERDSYWRDHKKITDHSPTQWEQVLNDLNIESVYALSPQVKGKVERSYQWLQDSLVRTYARENIKEIKQAHTILKAEVARYNNKQVHSTKVEKKSMYRKTK